MQHEIFTGVLAGVLTSALIWLTGSLWTRSVEPYLIGLRYRGIDIAGPWTAIDIGPENASRFSMDLRQTAHSVRGTCMLEHYSAENEFKVMLELTGDLWEGYISLTHKPSDRKISSYSVGLLKVSGGGTGLEGIHLYRNVNEERVEEMPVSFVRGTGNGRHVIAFNEAAARFQNAFLAGPATPTEARPTGGNGTSESDEAMSV